MSLLGGVKGLPAWRAWERDARASAAELTTEASRAERAAAARGSLLDTLKAREARLVALAPALLPGNSPATAGAALAGLISDAAIDAGVRLGAVQVRPDSTSGGFFTRVAVRGDGVGDVRGIAELLARIERDPALLAVREFAITQPEPAAGSDRPEALRLEFVVEGLVHNLIRKKP